MEAASATTLAGAALGRVLRADAESVAPGVESDAPQPATANATTKHTTAAVRVGIKGILQEDSVTSICLPDGLDVRRVNFDTDRAVQ